MSSLAEVLVLSLLYDLKCQRAYDCTAFQVAISTCANCKKVLLYRMFWVLLLKKTFN